MGWFSVTVSIQKAVTLINNIDDGKLKRILARVIQKIHLKDETAFTEDEEEKLQVAFDLSASDIECILATVSFIFEQAAYHNAKGHVLKEQLDVLQLNESKVDLFIQIWSENSATVIQFLRHRNLGPKQLESVNWQLNMQAGKSFQSNLNSPSAILEFNLSSTENKAADKIQLEFNQPELYGLFQQLEEIQLQLDNLSR